MKKLISASLFLAAFVAASAHGSEVIYRAVAKADAPAAPSTGFVSVKTADESPVTELCVASITSSEKFETVKRSHFSGVSNLESIVQCNGLPLRSFMLKYNSRDMTAAL